VLADAEAGEAAAPLTMMLDFVLASFELVVLPAFGHRLGIVVSSRFASVLRNIRAGSADARRGHYRRTKIAHRGFLDLGHHRASFFCAFCSLPS